MKKRQYNLSKIVLVSIILSIVQVILITLFIHYHNNNPHTVEDNLIIYIIAISIGISSITIGITFYSLLFRKGNNNLIATIKQLEELNKTLRVQRHDYLNHIQVIYSLMELEEYEEAREYMEPVYKDIVRVSKALKTSIPAVNALLQAKIQVAEQNKIEMELEIKSDLKNLTMEPWEFCRVIGNVIDNGIFALKLKEDNRYMFVEFSEDMDNIRVSIFNNGPIISREILNKVFDEGFTTKGEKGTGMGLTIVKDLIEDFNGSINVLSNENRTSFEIVIPKKR